jgi:hypothetical protein
VYGPVRRLCNRRGEKITLDAFERMRLNRRWVARGELYMLTAFSSIFPSRGPLRALPFLGSGILVSLNATADPVTPWPVTRILERPAEAACAVEDLVLEGQNRAAQQAEKATKEKQPAIDDQTRIAEDANNKRKKGDNFNFETGIKRTGFSLDLPEITTSFGNTRIPTVHIKFAPTKIRILTLSQCSIGSTLIPEFRDLRMTMRMHTIYGNCSPLITVERG